MKTIVEWLATVVRTATAAAAALDNGDNELPAGFPDARLVAAARDTAYAAGLSPQSALPILINTADLIDETLNAWGGDDPGHLPRDGMVLAALSQLRTDIGATLKSYDIADAQRAEGASAVPAYVAVRAPAATVTALAEQSRAVATQTSDLAAAVRKNAIVGSAAAANLAQEIEGTSVLATAEASELSSGAEQRLRRVDRLGASIEQGAGRVSAALEALRPGIDIATVGFERLRNAVLNGIGAVSRLAASVRGFVRAYWPRWRPQPFEHFRDKLKDGSDAPEMIVLPPGKFWRGSPDSDKEAYPDEKPRLEVAFVRAFALARDPVTFDEYDAFCEATRHEAAKDEWGRGAMPVINVTWKDAVAYCAWLSRETGFEYRLPSEAEWEYACRAGTESRYWWGDAFDPKMANGARAQARTTPVGSYPKNPWGLRDLHGNVLEWCMDTWHDSYVGAPADGSAWVDSRSFPRVVRGGSWNIDPRSLRAAIRYWYVVVSWILDLGFRPARTL